MNLHLTLKLMTIPTLIGSVLTIGFLTERASAINASYGTALAASQATCEISSRESESLTLRHLGQGITVASASLNPDESAMSDFNEAESDAAAVLFGCDCSACINALRQLRNQSLFNNGSSSNGHCWTSLQRRVSPQRMQEVLRNLEMREAEQGR